MKKFTVLCSEPDGSGTMWIDTIEARSTAEAIDLGLAKCRADWGGETDALVRGVFAGEPELLHWEDP